MIPLHYPTRPDFDLPECDAGCGRECGLIEEVRRDWTWTCSDCERETAMEHLWEERNDR